LRIGRNGRAPRNAGFFEPDDAATAAPIAPSTPSTPTAIPTPLGLLFEFIFLPPKRKTAPLVVMTKDAGCSWSSANPACAGYVLT